MHHINFDVEEVEEWKLIKYIQNGLAILK
jgi:hypothetical protein